MADMGRFWGIAWYELKMRWLSAGYWIVMLLVNAYALFVPSPLNHRSPEMLRLFRSSWWMAGQSFTAATPLMSGLGVFLIANSILRLSVVGIALALLGFISLILILGHSHQRSTAILFFEDMTSLALLATTAYLLARDQDQRTLELVLLATSSPPRLYVRRFVLVLAIDTSLLAGLAFVWHLLYLPLSLPYLAPVALPPVVFDHPLLRAESPDKERQHRGDAHCCLLAPAPALARARPPGLVRLSVSLQGNVLPGFGHVCSEPLCLAPGRCLHAGRRRAGPEASGPLSLGAAHVGRGWAAPHRLIGAPVA